MNKISLCRPLILPSISNTQKYIQLPYQFTVQQIQNFVTYLPKSLKFMGIDFQNQIPENLKSLKIKCKNIGIMGELIENKTKIQFINNNKLINFQWNVNLSLSIDFNKKMSPDRKNNYINQFLENYCNIYIQGILTDGSILRKQRLLQADIINMEIIAGVPSIPRCTSTHTINVNSKIPIKICLLKDQPIDGQQLIKQIRIDILDALSIMINNNLSIRVVKSGNKKYEHIYLQTYCKQLPLTNPFNSINNLQKIFKQPQLIRQKSINNYQQQTYLIIGLIVIILFYLGLKFM